VAYGVLLAAATPAAWLLLLPYIAVLLFALNRLRRRARGDVPRAVVTLIAGMSVLDGLVLAGAGLLLPGLLALAGFGLTLLLQKWVAGT
jgi:hypothetical protein